MPVKKQTEYTEYANPLGYIQNREITNLDGQYLVQGSQNTIIVKKEKVSTRKGYTLVGAAKTSSKVVEGSFDWKTSSGFWRNIRSYDDELEFWYPDSEAWLRIKDGFSSAKFEFAPWWDSTELIDVLLMVNGDDFIREWSGGVSEVASVTSNTIVKKGYITGATFAFSDNGASADTVTDSGSGFVTGGFASGDIINISGSTSNDGNYTIDSVAAGTLTLIADDSLTTEAAGDTVIVKWKQLGTWAQSRFFTADTRKVTIDGVDYTYTGGESTGTLTGITPSPVTNGVSAGDLAIQTIRDHEPATLDGFSNDLINVYNNHILISSKTSRVVYGSKDTDFTDFGFSTPRAIGEGFELTLDSAPTAIIPDEDVLKISGGYDDFYNVRFILSGEQSYETLTIDKLKTATGQAARSQGAVVNMKNNIAILSFEPTIDTIGRVENIEGPDTTPLSDPIKNDLDSYDLTNVHGIYANRNIYYTLPNETKILIFDLQDRLWQPPQTIPVQRLALIDIEGDGNVRLCGHSSTGNETYRLFNGNTDNGVPFKCVAAFGYDNFGSRYLKKQFDGMVTEAYMSENTILKRRVVYDYKGSTGTKEVTIDGSDSTGRFSPALRAGFGKLPLGSAPLGSLATDPDDLNKYRRIHEVPLKDFYERQVVFESDSDEARFEILSYGENVVLSENLPNEIKS